MSTNITTTSSPTPNPTSTDPTRATQQPPPKGQRKNGKNWHPLKPPFRPSSNQTPYIKRMALLQTSRATKMLEQEMKAGKAAERDRRVQAIKDRRRAKEEKERFEKMAERLHWKVVERRRRRERRSGVVGK